MLQTFRYRGERVTAGPNAKTVFNCLWSKLSYNKKNAVLTSNIDGEGFTLLPNVIITWCVIFVTNTSPICPVLNFFVFCLSKHESAKKENMVKGMVLLLNSLIMQLATWLKRMPECKRVSKKLSDAAAVRKVGVCLFPIPSSSISLPDI